MAALVAVWLSGFLFIFSIGEVKYDSTSFFGTIDWSQQTKAYIGLMIFGVCWWISFILSTGIFVISSMSASWYFDPQNNGINFLVGYCWAYTYHIGTLAFGSLIIAILWFIQLVLEYVYQKVKNTDSTVAFVVKCSQCFVACFERLMKFVNRHAFIEVVIRKTYFCRAVFIAVGLLTGNFIRVGALMGLVGLVLFLNIVLVTFCVCLICYFTIYGIGVKQNISYDTVGPIVVCGVIAVVISSLFNYIFSVTSDTLLHCYIYEEQNPESATGKLPNELKEAVEVVNSKAMKTA